MHIIFPLTVLVMATSHLFYPVLFNAEFAESATIFNIYLLLVTSRFLFPQVILIGMERTRSIIMASSVELLLNISLSLILVRFWGLPGIAFATVVAYALEKVMLAISVKRHLGIGVREYVPGIILMRYSAALLIVFVVTEYILF